MSIDLKSVKIFGIDLKFFEKSIEEKLMKKNGKRGKGIQTSFTSSDLESPRGPGESPGFFSHDIIKFKKNVMRFFHRIC